MNRTRAQRRTIARSGTEASGSYYQETTARRSNFQCGGSVMRHTIRVLFLLMAGLSTSTTMAQQVVGETICACQPGTYTMALQLNLTCGDRTIGEDITPGVNDTTCFIAPRSPGETVEDFVPTTVQEIQVFELDQLQDVVRSRVYESAFMDGDTVEYSSYVVSNPNNITATTLPKVLAVTLTARNAAGQPLLNTWAIRFDNDCGIYPVLTPGERIGWIRFADLAPPPAEGDVCPLVSSQPSEFPTLSPTTLASSVPSVSPSRTPTSPPTIVSSTSPSAGPSAASSLAASSGPTERPSATPSVVPSRAPTKFPTSSPTLQPTGIPGSPTTAPVATLPPTLSPTGTPTTVPTFSPTFAETASPIMSPTLSPSVSRTKPPVPMDTTDVPTPTPTDSRTQPPVPMEVTATPTTTPTVSRTEPPVPMETTAIPTTTTTVSRTEPPVPMEATGMPTTPPADSRTEPPVEMPSSMPSCAPTGMPLEEEKGDSSGNKRYRKKKSSKRGMSSKMKKSSSSSSSSSDDTSTSVKGKKPTSPGRKKDKKVREQRGARMDKVEKTPSRRRRLMVGPRPTPGPVGCPEAE